LKTRFPPIALQAPTLPASDLPPPPPMNVYAGGFGTAYGYDDGEGSNQTDGVHDVRGRGRALC